MRQSEQSKASTDGTEESPQTPPPPTLVVDQHRLTVRDGVCVCYLYFLSNAEHIPEYESNELGNSDCVVF